MADFAFSAVGACATSCRLVLQHLQHAKHNKQELRSCARLIGLIEHFLAELQRSEEQRGTPAIASSLGRLALGNLKDVLDEADQLLRRVGSTGPLVSLLWAGDFRDQLLRINRDLSAALQLLGTSEQLLRESSAAAGRLQVAQRELNDCSGFFVQQEQAGERLKDVAMAARKSHQPEQLLQRQLREELASIAEVVALSPDELVVELQALQLAAQYDRDVEAGVCKKLGPDTEEFLVQQLCAALTPRVPGPVSPDDLTPDSFLCPIGRSVMVRPTMLVQTEHSFEEAHLRRWLETHDTCPATAQRLTSKAVAPNEELRQAIEAWSESHGVKLPAPPVYKPLLPAGAVPEPGTGSNGGSDTRGSRDQGTASSGPAAGSKPAAPWRCTRTRWAVAAISLLVLAAVGMVVGVGVGVAMRNRKPPTTGDAQKDALLRIKAAIDPGNALSWDRGISVCSWPGVFCEGGAVTELAVFERTTGATDTIDATQRNSAFVGPLGGTLPPASAFEGLGSLASIVLGGLNLTGPLPDWSSLRNLTVIDLSHNLLSGGLERAGFDRLDKLDYLALHHNAFSGTLPASWGKLSRLSGLASNHNQLTGTLPSAAWTGMVSLKNLTLHSNAFNGTLPASWVKLSRLRQVVLNNNQLTGTLPSAWSDMVRLEDLRLPRNALTGTLPASWGALSTLRILSLSSNRLVGTVPREWSSMTNLTALFLRDNPQLTGRLPANFEGQLEGNTSVPLVDGKPDWTNVTYGTNISGFDN